MAFVRKLNLRQPSSKKKVVELAVGGRIGKWFLDRNWGGTTIPLPFIVVILYYASDAQPTPFRWVRLHEFQHVFQDERNRCFLQTLINYFWAARHGYAKNKYEVEAYAVEQAAMDADVYPDWC